MGYVGAGNLHFFFTQVLFIHVSSSVRITGIEDRSAMTFGSPVGLQST